MRKEFTQRNKIFTRQIFFQGFKKLIGSNKKRRQRIHFISKTVHMLQADSFFQNHVSFYKKSFSGTTSFLFGVQLKNHRYQYLKKKFKKFCLNCLKAFVSRRISLAATQIFFALNFFQIHFFLKISHKNPQDLGLAAGVITGWFLFTLSMLHLRIGDLYEHDLQELHVLVVTFIYVFQQNTFPY